MTVFTFLPIKNEALAIPKVIGELNPNKFNLFAVVGPSTDGSDFLLQKANIDFILEREGGKGLAITLAMNKFLQGSEQTFAMIDCDGTISVRDLEVGIELLTKNQSIDICIGNRFNPMSDPNSMTKLAKITNRTLSFIISSWFLGSPKALIDVQSPLWVMRREAVNVLSDQPLKSKYFEIEAEMVMKSLSKNLSIKQYPIKYQKRIGKSKFDIKLKIRNLIVLPLLLFYYSRPVQKLIFLSILALIGLLIGLIS